jgi:hypothetical protein
MLCVFFSLYVLKNERKESKTPNNFNLVLKARIVNFKDSLLLSSMKDSKKGFKHILSLILELMVMAKFMAFDNNQCPIDWFKMQAKTTRLKQSTIV